MNPIILALLLEEDEYLEEMLTSSSSSDDDDDDPLEATILLKKYSKEKTKYPNNDEISQNYSDEEFIKEFRLSKAVVRKLIEQYEKSDIYAQLTKHANSRAFSLSAEKTILIFLWYAGHHNVSFRDVGEKFDSCIQSVHGIITRMCEFLATLENIQFPSKEKQVETMAFFHQNEGIPKVIGCIAETHIKLDKPAQRHLEYINNRGYYSIILQGICDERKKFIDIFMERPISSRDAATVLLTSSIYEKLRNSNNDFYILGDSSYPLLPYLMTPYTDRDQLTPAQRNFNKKISTAGLYIENAFEMLKQRFKQLHHVKLQGHERICKFIKACCVLHNLGDETDMKIFEEEEVVLDIQSESDVLSTDGSNIRNQLCMSLFASN